MNLISGDWEGQKAAFESSTGVYLSTLFLESGGSLTIAVPEEHNIFFYTIRGHLNVNRQEVKALQLVEFDKEGRELLIHAVEQSVVLLGHARPLDEPVVAQGPFVMNTQEEIVQAYEDYRRGKFGTWQF